MQGEEDERVGEDVRGGAVRVVGGLPQEEISLLREGMRDGSKHQPVVLVHAAVGVIQESQ